MHEPASTDPGASPAPSGQYASSYAPSSLTMSRVTQHREWINIRPPSSDVGPWRQLGDPMRRVAASHARGEERQVPSVGAGAIHPVGEESSRPSDRVVVPVFLHCSAHGTLRSGHVGGKSPIKPPVARELRGSRANSSRALSGIAPLLAIEPELRIHEFGPSRALSPLVAVEAALRHGRRPSPTTSTTSPNAAPPSRPRQTRRVSAGSQ
jgi:hypothetical protein